MNRKFSQKKARDFFIKIGRKHPLLRIPALIGLTFFLLFSRIWDYFCTDGKRLTCAAFVICCFFVGNSFAYPVFKSADGFVSEDAELAGLQESSDSITEEGETEYLTEDVLLQEEGADDSEYHDSDQLDRYSLDDILSENQDLLISSDEDEDANENVDTDADVDTDTDTDTGADTETSEDVENGETDFREDDWKLILINKQHPIPDDYSFTLGNIKTMKGTMKCDERIIEDLLAMMQDAKKDGVNLAICSPYRDMDYQEMLFDRKIKNYMSNGMSYMGAYRAASQAVTLPGASEHQVGLAIDIVCDTYQSLDEGFGETDAGIWLKEHCSEYGFILRYPEGKEYITSIEYEPWHFRYVGQDAATIIMNQNLCLEEFWDRYL